MDAIDLTVILVALVDRLMPLFVTEQAPAVSVVHAPVATDALDQVTFTRAPLTGLCA